MIKVALVRGKYLNNFEGQNYIFSKDKISLTAIGSLKPIHSQLPFPVVKLPSLADLGLTGIVGRLIKIVSNRTLGDSQILLGLERYASKFDIFHTADPHYYYSYQLARLRAKNLIKKLMVTSWETIPFNNERTVRKAKIKKFTQRFADLFICYTEKAKKALIKEGVNEEKIKVVRLGVDLERFKIQNSKFNPALREGPGKSQNDNLRFKILFVGRLVEEKGIMDLYEAYKRIKNLTLNQNKFGSGQELKIQNYSLKLKIVGDGPLRNKIKTLISKDSLGDFVTIEQNSYEEMPKVYQQADILVVPSKRTKTWEEQYGMVLIEAMASGLPIIAYRSGAIPEVLGKTGLLVKEGDVNGLTDSIIQLIKDYNLKEKLGRMGRERAEKYFDAKKTRKILEEIYRDLLR